MACRLVALDKSPGVRPVGFSELFRRLWAKCQLKVIGTQATLAYGNYNRCAGLAAGIEGAIHAVREVCDAPLTAASLHITKKQDTKHFVQSKP